MRPILVGIAYAALLGGCADMQPGEPTWYKPGGTQQAFAEDKYQCMSNSQMEVSGAVVNANGGVASSGATTNTPLFKSCMEARGYVFIHVHEAKAVPDDPAKVSQMWCTALHNQYDEFTRTQQFTSAASSQEKARREGCAWVKQLQ
jgi:hypothetical protein